MNHVVCTTTLFLLLSASSSNQPADVSQQRFDNNQSIEKTVESNAQQPRPPIIPIDGRLRNEHMQMYVSVKIRQEQIRYQHKKSNTPVLSKNNAAPINNTVENQPVNQNNSDTVGNARLNERLAIEEFEFNVQLYHWVKQTIQRTQARSLEEDVSKYKRVSNFEEYVLAHNLKMLKKHEDELRFAAKYKLSPPSPINQYSSNMMSGVTNQQTSLTLKPSS